MHIFVESLDAGEDARRTAQEPPITARSAGSVRTTEVPKAAAQAMAGPLDVSSARGLAQTRSA
ncbi:hypothetical protein AAFF27_20190 [Xylophilus sp. GW821-FHT01B05]